MGDILIHLASRILRLMGLRGCGDRGSDRHQIHGPVAVSQRSWAAPAPLRPAVMFGLDDAFVAPLLSMMRWLPAAIRRRSTARKLSSTTRRRSPAGLASGLSIRATS